MDILPEAQEKLGRVLAKVNEMIPPVETVLLKLSRGETKAFDSKMGGVPYFPKTMEYPTVREGVYKGLPLRLLAQLNFGSLPNIEGFPAEGILQFFAFPDDRYGADLNSPCNQNSFRVIYHEQIITDTAALIDSVPAFEIDKEHFPFTGEFLLTAEPLEKMAATLGDFRGEKAIAKAYGELFGGDIKSFFDIMDVDPDFTDAVFDNCCDSGTRIGGYPFFTPDDPRGYQNEFDGHTVLLFQSDIDSGGEGWKNQVCWVNMGVANFFSTPGDLAKRDFSNVIYN